jgi:hypothetical protein
MNKKRMSGHCRSITLAVLFLILFCSAVASAATASAATTASCPSGCSCLRPADAKEKGYDPCGGQLSACGYDIYQKTMYCYKTSLSLTLRTLPPLSIATTTTQPQGNCLAGCSCMMESAAKDKFQGVYRKCGNDPCYTVVTGAAQVSAYCFGPGTVTTTPTPAPCSGEGCSCISEATAKAKGGSWSKCSPDICGYEQSTATFAAAAQVPKFCMRQQETTTPTPATVCKAGCACLSNAQAKERYGTYTQCSPDVCGYEQSTQTTAAYQVPKYCVQQGTTPVCPEGCSCISESDAKLKGLDKCDPKENPCGYQSVAGTANTAANRIPLYCYKTGMTTITPQPVCEKGCYCLKPDEAKEKFGPTNYERCKPEPCSSDQSRYCFRPLVTPTPTPAVCPQGCVCTTDEIAKLKGLTPCRGQRTSCGYNSDKQPLYCFEQVPSPTCVYDYQKNACTGTCPEGYTCGLLASRQDATGKVEYAVCGCTGQPTGQCTFDKEKQTCTGTCQSGATCAIVGKKVDDKTGEVYVVCGCPKPSTGQCAYDREKQACTGTCDNGAACAVTGKKTDDAGNVYVFCGCPQPSSCSYDYSKEACVGTCTATGDICQLNTIYRDPTTGKVTYAECHCKGGGGVPDTCAFNADHYCVGTCPQGGQCANTSVVDASGKMTFVCTCAGGQVPETCTCDMTTGSCTGSCADNRACTMVEHTTDNAGKVICSKCECRDTCVLTANNECSGTCSTGAPCARMVTKDDSGNEKVSCICGGTQPGTPAGVAPSPQGFFEGISKGIISFFNKLFGGK